MTIWMASNLLLVERMNQNLISAGNKQDQILTLLRPYLAAIPNGSVLAVRYEHTPLRTLPYPLAVRVADGLGTESTK